MEQAEILQEWEKQKGEYGKKYGEAQLRIDKANKELHLLNQRSRDRYAASTL